MNRPQIGDRAHVALPVELAVQVEAIVRRARRGRIGGCAHLDAVPVAMVCLLHPGGLVCPACYRTHSSTHTAAEEFGCDLCGAHMPTGTDMAVNLARTVELDTLVPIGRGRSAAVGVLVVAGWGACREHFHVIGGAG